MALQLEYALARYGVVRGDQGQELSKQCRRSSKRPPERCRHVVLVSAEKVEDGFYRPGMEE